MNEYSCSIPLVLLPSHVSSLKLFLHCIMREKIFKNNYPLLFLRYPLVMTYSTYFFYLRKFRCVVDSLKLCKSRHIIIIYVCSGERNKGHIPYRDSKLTRILQHSLGGNARTAIICTLSPALSHVDQTRNTLSFATSAKEVTNNARVNMVCNFLTIHLFSQFLMKG